MSKPAAASARPSTRLSGAPQGDEQRGSHALSNGFSGRSRIVYAERAEPPAETDLPETELKKKGVSYRDLADKLTAMRIK
jgi:hypothetical protein